MNGNNIVSFFNCTQCIREKPGNESPERWARLNVGMTPSGIQVWCVRHRREVVSLTAEQIGELVAEPPACDRCGHHHGSAPCPGPVA